MKKTSGDLTQGPVFKTLFRYSVPIIAINVVSIAKDKITLLCFTYFVTSIMEVFAFSLRSLRHEKSTMVVGAVCGLGARCLWAWFIWPFSPPLPMLFSSYAISAFFAIIIYLFVYKKAVKSLRQEFTSNMQND